MINIAVIDDEKSTRDLTENEIRKFVVERENAIVIAKDEEKKPIKIYSYDSAKAFFEDIEKGIHFHIVFSDIEMPEINGIELGENLKKIWPNIYLIFVTAYSEFAYRGFLLNAYQYILKDEMSERMPKILKEVVRKVEKEVKSMMVIGCPTDQRVVYCSDIICIKKDKSAKYVEYVTATEKLRDRKTLDQALAQARNNEFVRVERGYAVNIRHVRRLKGNTITLSNGDELIVSRMRIAEVKQKINQHWGELC